MHIGNAEVGMMPPPITAIKSIQHITVTIPSGSTGNTTINAVDTDFTSIIYGGYNTTDTSGSADSEAVLSLTSSTNVNANSLVTIGAAGTTYNATIVEWDSAFVESVQQGVMSGTTQAISSVVTANSVCLQTGSNRSANATAHANFNKAVWLTSSTNVQAQGGATNVGWCVVEFKAGVLTSNQQVSISGYDGNTATITAVDMSNAVMFFGNFYHTGGGTVSVYRPRFELTNTTTVTIKRGSTSTSTPVVGKLNVVEFDPAFLKSVQRGTITYTGASGTDTVTAVDTEKAFPIYLGSTTSTGTRSGNFSKVRLTDPTTVTASAGNNSGTANMSYELPEFN